MRMIRPAALTAAITILLGLAPCANAWSFKEHIQFTRLAAMRIIADDAAPADLKQWLKAQTPLLRSMDAERDFFLTASVGENPDASKLSGLTWWVCVPDLEALDRSAGNNGAFGKHERLSHFIDLEFFNLVPAKRTYQLDLSSLPTPEQIPHDVKNETFTRAGYLPFACENAYSKLVESIRAGRLAPDPAKPEDQDHAVRWAAFLAHYVQDNTQPQHATMDYKSAQYFDGKRAAPNVHAEVEYRMGDDATQPLPELRKVYWDAFAAELTTIKDGTKQEKLFEATIEVAMRSYRTLPLIGEAARQAIKDPNAAKPEVDTDRFFRFVGTLDGKPTSVIQMKAHQTAWAVARTERLLRQAWAEAGVNRVQKAE